MWMSRCVSAMSSRTVAVMLAGSLAAACSASPAADRPPAPGAALASPFAGLIVRALHDHETCPTPPAPFTGSLEFASKYEGSGKARDELNEDAEARYKSATRPMQELESGLSSLSDHYVRGDSAAAGCALDWMDRWAQADALLGSANMTGKAVRKWTLAALAFNYLKIKDEPSLDAGERRRVQDWMVKVANRVIAEHSHLPPEKLNNHFYWAAAAVGATGIATQNDDLMQWAMDSYRRSVQAIDADGVLPREMARRSRALAYHVFALQPLVMLAEMGRVNGVDLYAEDDCALCRLIRRVATGIQDPSYFEQRTGSRQAGADKVDGHDMIWVAILAHACPQDEKLQALKARYRPFIGRRLGGNLTDVYDHISKELPNAVESKACSNLWR